MTLPPVPFLDLVTPHRELEEELVAVFREALRSAAFIGGPQVENFEREFADYCTTKYCVGVANGTDAVRFALMAAGVGRGDAVVTVSHTFIATVEAISQAGADTEFVDIDERTYCMSPQALADYLKGCAKDPRTGRLLGRRSGKPLKAVVPVHLYGQVADMDPILEIARDHDLLVVEDACQAQGAEYHSAQKGWRRAGSFGKAAAFSFYPGKNLGACGEAGAVTTDDEQVARTIRMLREHGQVQKVLPRSGRVQRPPRRDSSRISAHQASSPRRLECAASIRCSSLRDRAIGSRGYCDAVRTAEQFGYLPPVCDQKQRSRAVG